MIVTLNRGRGEDRREPRAVRQYGRGTAAQVRHAAGESDSVSDGFPQDPVSLRAAENSCTNRIIRTICPLLHLPTLIAQHSTCLWLRACCDTPSNLGKA